MNASSTSLPDDPNKLKELVIELRDQINVLKSEVTTNNARIDHRSNTTNQLIEAIALARQQYFSSRGQKVDTDSTQLSWLFNETEALADQDSDDSNQGNDEPGTDKKRTSPRKRRTGGRKKLLDHFPRIEVVHVLDGDNGHCDHCQGELKVLGDKTSGQVELIPLTVKVIKHIKKTYHCANCQQGIKAAKLPPQPIPGSIASPGTLACVAGHKFVNGLPLYRQAQDLKRVGMPISCSTLTRWMIKAGILIQPLINLLNDQLLIYDIIVMDETRCQLC